MVSRISISRRPRQSISERPISSAWRIGWMAARQRLKVLWPILGLALVAVWLARGARSCQPHGCLWRGVPSQHELCNSRIFDTGISGEHSGCCGYSHLHGPALLDLAIEAGSISFLLIVRSPRLAAKSRLSCVRTESFSELDNFPFSPSFNPRTCPIDSKLRGDAHFLL